jgi:hypothetical protein
MQPLGSSQHFMEPEGSLPSSQELSTCTYPEPLSVHGCDNYLVAFAVFRCLGRELPTFPGNLLYPSSG